MDEQLRMSVNVQTRWSRFPILARRSVHSLASADRRVISVVQLTSDGQMTAHDRSCVCRTCPRQFCAPVIEWECSDFSFVAERRIKPINDPYRCTEVDRLNDSELEIMLGKEMRVRIHM